MKCVRPASPRGRVQSGSRISLQRPRPQAVTRVVFRGARGKRDDVAVGRRRHERPARDRDGALPAQSGPIAAAAGERRSKATPRLTIMPPLDPIPSAQLTPVSGPRDPGAPTRRDRHEPRASSPSASAAAVQFSYRVNDSSAVSSRSRSSARATARTVATWNPPAGGRRRGEDDRLGRQRERPRPLPRAATRSSSSRARRAARRRAAPATRRRDAFDLYQHLFPIRGRHNYGQSGARFGAGRSGHSHQGQDVMAACGTPLVAARGGVVKVKPLPLGRRQLPRDRRRRHGRGLRLHAPGAAVSLRRGRARVHRRADRRGGHHRLARPPATSTSRCGARPAGTTAASRSTRSPTCGRGTATARPLAAHPHAERHGADHGADDPGARVRPHQVVDRESRHVVAPAGAHVGAAPAAGALV